MVANLITVGNAVCGFIAITLMAGGAAAGAPPPQIKHAAWLILFGMVFDVLDGRVARSTGTTSELGAQLDTLADLTTFGVAPALLAFRLHQTSDVRYVGTWALWCFCIAYFLGAVLRLARFTVENSDDESAHLCFKGLPSPGAAGVIASAAILYFYLVDFKHAELQWKWVLPWKDQIQNAAQAIPLALPYVAGLLGYTMVSNRLRYVHVAGHLLSRRSFDMFAYVIFGLLVVIVFPELALPLIFFGYLASAPVKFLLDQLARRRKPDRADPQ